MRVSSLTQRIAGEGAEAWRILEAARKREAAGEEVIILSLGDPDFATPASICDAAIAAMRNGDTHYSDIVGRPSLRRKIVNRHRALGGGDYGEDNVIVLAGAQCALFSSIQCIAETGDEVIILDPAYVTYEAVVRASGADLVRVAQPAGTGFRPDIAAIEAAVTPRTRAIVITNPNNPTGVVMRKEELEAIADIARRHDLWVVSDEVYGDLVFDGTHIPIAGLPGMAERTVTVGSVSKSHAMTGWRAGWAIAPVELVGHLANLALCMLYGLPGFVQQGAEAAFDAGEEIIADMRDTYQRRRDKAYAILSRIQSMRCHLPASGMFLMADIRPTGLDCNTFAWRLFEEHHVAVLNAEPFGACAEGHLRIAFTIGEEEMEEACRRIAGFVESLDRPN